jgi:uncharacterized Rmd1/YagE family protein
MTSVTTRRRQYPSSDDTNPLLQSNELDYSTFQQPNFASTTGARNTKPKQPNRTTKISQKLKLFPENDDARTVEENLFDADVYTQLAQIPHGSARIEAERLNKLDRNELSRATAYCTAS